MIDIDMFVQLIPWVLPPLLGALIGYVTNALAIRMLFRPLSRIRIGPIPVPFTPGVIPRRREELAESIGRMVSRDLLTTDVFTERFRNESFRLTLRRGIHRLLESVGDTPVRDARAVIDPVSLVNVAETLVLTTLQNTVDVRRAIQANAVDYVVSHADSISVGVDKALAGAPVLRALSDDHIERLVSELWPHVRETAERALHDPETQRQFQGILRRVLSYTLDQLNSFQRLVVTAGQYDRQLLARVPTITSRITAELGAFLHRPETGETVARRVQEWVAARRSQPFSELISPAGRSMVERSIAEILSDRDRVDRIVTRGIELLGGDDSIHHLFVTMKRTLSRFLDEHASVPLKHILPFVDARKGYLSRIVTSRLSPLLANIAPKFVAHLNIYQVVVDRINDLEIRQVEGLLLGIIRRHLRWINLFGALLGAAIGTVQLVLRAVGL